MIHRRWLQVVAALAAVTFLPGPAHAEGPAVPGVRVSAEDGTVSQRVVIGDLFPSARRQAVLLLEGEARDTARRMKVSVANLAQLENDCNRPEQHVGDPTCDGDEGELADFVALTLQAGTEADDEGSCDPVGSSATGTLAELVDREAVVGLSDGDEGVLCVVATFEHVVAADDNLTQTDSATFDLGLSVDGLSAPEVLGEQEVQPDEPDPQPAGPTTQDVVTPTVVDAGVLDLRLAGDRRIGPMLAVLGGVGLLGVAVVVLRRDTVRTGRRRQEIGHE